MATATKKRQTLEQHNAEEAKKDAASRELNAIRRVNEALAKDNKELRRSPAHALYDEKLGRFYVATLPANLGYFDSPEAAAEKFGVSLG